MQQVGEQAGMSVVSMAAEPKRADQPSSGGAMDKVVQRRTPPLKAKLALGAVGVAALLGVAWFAMPDSSSQTVPKAGIGRAHV